MRPETAGKAVRQLLPTLGVGPRAFATQITWLLPASVLLVYLTLMPVIALPDVTLRTYSVQYMTTVGLSLVPMLAIAVSVWLVYGYVYGLTVPVIRLMGEGRPLTHMAVGFAAQRVLRVLIRLALAWAAYLVGLFSHEALPMLRAALLPLIGQHLPVHIATGWRAGTHPIVLYAPAPR